MNKRKLSSSSNAKLTKVNKKTFFLQVTNRNYLLNEHKASWIKLMKLNQNEFEQLWSLKPSEKLEIKIAGKIIDCSHYFRIYLRAYKFIFFNRTQRKVEWYFNKYVELLYLNENSLFYFFSI